MRVGQGSPETGSVGSGWADSPLAPDSRQGFLCCRQVPLGYSFRGLKHKDPRER